MSYIINFSSICSEFSNYLYVPILEGSNLRVSDFPKANKGTHNHLEWGFTKHFLPNKVTILHYITMISI